jgi:hypothetical protein
MVFMAVWQSCSLLVVQETRFLLIILLINSCMLSYTVYVLKHKQIIFSNSLVQLMHMILMKLLSTTTIKN